MKAALSLTLLFASAMQASAMIWVSNQAAWKITAQISNRSGGSAGTYTIPPNAWESRSLNGWARKGEETVTIKLNGKSKSFNAPANSHVFVYEDRIQVIKAESDALAFN
ncbi:hypothetical protein HGRIS_014805 [Hohenbuehelia grisea]|uniref:Uncharacterized protein n=1 Tax=Hohenbuehelia grisea TaxID=104357 RepID=A0ABR3IQS2_9AGAR